MERMETTLLYLRKNNQLLLGLKKRGFGEGKFNGIGGKVEKGETFEEAMIRETYEEIKVTPTVFEKFGEIEFLEFYKGKKVTLRFHLYIATAWKGIPTETEEIRPEWFDIEKLPYDKMFEDDQYWLPLVLKNKKLKAFFEFDENWKMLSHRVEEQKESKIKRHVL